MLAEFDRLAERGGVLGAMETGYQRGRIQDESMLYETRKHDGTLPIIGVNTFLHPATASTTPGRVEIELARSTDDEKQWQLARLADFQARHADERAAALDRLRQSRPGRREPLRGADGRRALLHPRRDHPRPLRGRRPLPPQSLTEPG